MQASIVSFCLSSFHKIFVKYSQVSIVIFFVFSDQRNDTRLHPTELCASCRKKVLENKGQRWQSSIFWLSEEKEFCSKTEVLSHQSALIVDMFFSFGQSLTFYAIKLPEYFYFKTQSLYSVFFMIEKYIDIHFSKKNASFLTLDSKFVIIQFHSMSSVNQDQYIHFTYWTGKQTR